MMPALSQSESDVVNTMLRAKRKIEVVIPDDLGPKEVLDAIRSIGTIMIRSGKVQGRCLAAFGRLMLITSRRPEIWMEAGHDTFKKFLSVEIISKLDCSRSTLYNCRRIIKCFPGLDMDVYGKVPTNSLMLLCKFTTSAASDAQKLLDKAAELPHEEFKLWLIDKGYLGSEDVAGGDFIRITGPLPEIRRIKKKLADERVQAHAGSKEPWKIISAALISFELEIKPE